MKKLLFWLTVTAIKVTAIMVVLVWGLSWYDLTVPFYCQHWLVWLLVYLPGVMGFESLINAVLDPNGK